MTTANAPRRKPTEPRLRTASLRQTGDTPVLLEPDAAARAALAQELGIEAVRKLRFEGSLTPRGRDSWQLTAKMGATVVQSCIVTLEPVTTRLDTVVTRTWVPAHKLDAPEAGSETEIPEDDAPEALPETIDMEAILHEELSLALPAYPRKDDADLTEANFAEDGVTPMTDEDVKPFAGLAALKQKMEQSDKED